MPVESKLIGNIHGELPIIQESFATEIGSAPLLLGDLRNLSAADQKWYHEKIAWYKKLRSTTKISESFSRWGVGCNHLRQIGMALPASNIVATA
jgi:alpha-galactosidase